MPFRWVLRCSRCRGSFFPLEDDWDGKITCRLCLAKDFIVEDDEHPDPAPLVRVIDIKTGLEVDLTNKKKKNNKRKKKKDEDRHS